MGIVSLKGTGLPGSLSLHDEEWPPQRPSSSFRPEALSAFSATPRSSQHICFLQTRLAACVLVIPSRD